MMRFNRRQLIGPLRIAIALTAVATLVAVTSGLLLAIHLNSIEHRTDHQGQDCSFCRHLLIPPKKFLPGPHGEFGLEVCVPCAVFAAPAPCVPDHHPRTSQPRAPPA
jgi:hypothetical protein